MYELYRPRKTSVFLNNEKQQPFPKLRGGDHPPGECCVRACWGGREESHGGGKKSYKSGSIPGRGSGTDQWDTRSLFTKNVCDEDYNSDLAPCTCLPSYYGGVSPAPSPDTRARAPGGSKRKSTPQKPRLSRKQKAAGSTQQPEKKKNPI